MLEQRYLGVEHAPIDGGLALDGAADPAHLGRPSRRDALVEVEVAAHGDLHGQGRGGAAGGLAAGARESLEGVGVPPMRDLVAKARASELPVFV